MQVRIAVLTLLLFAVLVVGRVQAQVATFHVTWDSANVPAPDIQGENDTVRYTMTVNNLTGSAFNDTLYFNLRTSLGTFQIAQFDSASIPAFGSTVFSFLDSTGFVGNKYSGGINIVVVWPTAAVQTVTDSLIDTLTILFNAVQDPRDRQILDIFPVPSHELVYLRLKDSHLAIAQTELYNMVGQVIRRFNGLPPFITVADLPDGVYFIKVEEESGQTSFVKVLKQ